MKVIPTSFPDVKLLQPDTFGDARGFFIECYNKRVMAEIGITAEFVQDNHSRSARNVLRGIHYQIQQPQGKLIRVVSGEIYDVAVDLRRASPTFGQWYGCVLSAKTNQMLWIPPGFGHGFLVLSEDADVLYKATDYYAPAHDRCVLWNDPRIGIKWPLQIEPILSQKDRAGKSLSVAEVYD